MQVLCAEPGAPRLEARRGEANSSRIVAPKHETWLRAATKPDETWLRAATKLGEKLATKLYLTH